MVSDVWVRCVHINTEYHHHLFTTVTGLLGVCTCVFSMFVYLHVCFVVCVCMSMCGNFVVCLCVCVYVCVCVFDKNQLELVLFSSTVALGNHKHTHPRTQYCLENLYWF